MSAGNVIAILAAAVAVAAVVVGWLQTNATLRQNRELADLEAVRSVLDDAATGLLKAAFSVVAIRGVRTQPVRMERLEGDVRQASEKLAGELERLKVRFGSRHPLVLSFAAAQNACSHLVDIAAAAPQGRPMGIDVGDEAAKRKAEQEKWADWAPSRIDGEAERFERERGRFLELAHELAGAKLKGRGLLSRASSG